MATAPDLLQLPERAIRAFEGVTGLSVVVHDFSATLSPFLLPERFRHHSATCAAIKATHDWACTDFELTRLPRELQQMPEGRYHICHAGFVEWVMPVFHEDRLAWILFAGQRRAAGEFRQLGRDRRTTHSQHHALEVLPAVREAEAEDILEALRQLRARLWQWFEEASPILGRGTPAERSGVATRRARIRRFIDAGHTSPAPLASLAAELHLTESRTMHLVRELFGQSYRQLLGEARLRTAAALLRDTSLPLIEVAMRSGYPDLSHFHRAFRKRFGTTPGKYRRVP